MQRELINICEIEYQILIKRGACESAKKPKITYRVTTFLISDFILMSIKASFTF